MENIFLGKFNLYQIILLLFTYSFLGWCLEVIYATTKNGKFVKKNIKNFMPNKLAYVSFFKLISVFLWFFIL